MNKNILNHDSVYLTCRIEIRSKFQKPVAVLIIYSTFWYFLFYFIEKGHWVQLPVSIS